MKPNKRTLARPFKMTEPNIALFNARAFERFNADLLKVYVHAIRCGVAHELAFARIECFLDRAEGTPLLKHENMPSHWSRERCRYYGDGWRLADHVAANPEFYEVGPLEIF